MSCMSLQRQALHTCMSLQRQALHTCISIHVMHVPPAQGAPCPRMSYMSYMPMHVIHAPSAPGATCPCKHVHACHPCPFSARRYMSMHVTHVSHVHACLPTHGHSILDNAHGACNPFFLWYDTNCQRQVLHAKRHVGRG